MNKEDICLSPESSDRSRAASPDSLTT